MDIRISNHKIYCMKLKNKEKNLMLDSKHVINIDQYVKKIFENCSVKRKYILNAD